jgi:hypothetical protein
MGQYSVLIGKRVEARYRAGDIQLWARGTLVAETARSVFLEERFVHNGREKTIRVEIPHDYLLDLLECLSEIVDRPEAPPSSVTKTS